MNPTDARMSLMVATKGGFTSTTDFYPLHYACERRPPAEIVQALIKLCPEAVSKRTMPGGALPLHIAATWYAPEDVIDALLAADRNACKTLDELGNLPIHSACFSGTSTAVVESLLKAYPKAILARNNQGSLPEDITKRLKHDNRVSTLALLNLCRDEVIARRQQKHRRNRSDGYKPTPKEKMILNER
jgi:ankyrin repeat protein